MALEVEERGGARVVVPRSVEGQPVARARADVAFRAELGTGAREREVDVEQDCSQASSHSTTSMCGAR